MRGMTSTFLAFFKRGSSPSGKEWNIAPKRIYLFGVSAGGYTAFDACMFDSEYFAGGGVFAAVIPDYDWIVHQAQRKIPIAIYLGDRDEFFTVAQAQSTRALLPSNVQPSIRILLPPSMLHYMTRIRQSSCWRKPTSNTVRP